MGLLDRLKDFRKNDGISSVADHIRELQIKLEANGKKLGEIDLKLNKDVLFLLKHFISSKEEQEINDLWDEYVSLTQEWLIASEKDPYEYKHLLSKSHAPFLVMNILIKDEGRI